MVTKIPKTLEFFDLKTKKKFKRTKPDFTVRTIMVRGSKRRQAVATAPSGMKAFRFLPN